MQTARFVKQCVNTDTRIHGDRNGYDHIRKHTVVVRHFNFPFLIDRFGLDNHCIHRQFSLNMFYFVN